MKVGQLRAFLEALEVRAGEFPDSLPIDALEATRTLLRLLPKDPSLPASELSGGPRKENIGSLVIKLGEVSKFKKQEWIQLIASYGIELETKPRDSARDVMFKLARHLRENPQALAAFSQTETNSPSTSPKRSSKGKRVLAENLEETLTRLLDK